MKKYVERVVEALAERVRVDPSGAKSLAHVCAVVPTAQSGRRLRLALAERFGALVPPEVRTPATLFLDPNDPALATRTDEIAAFSAALGVKDGDRRTSLEQARQLADIRNVLAAKPLSFADVAEAIRVDLPEEAERWRGLAEIEAKYLEELAKRGKRDKIQAIKDRMIEWSNNRMGGPGENNRVIEWSNNRMGGPGENNRMIEWSNNRMGGPGENNRIIEWSNNRMGGTGENNRIIEWSNNRIDGTGENNRMIEWSNNRMGGFEEILRFDEFVSQAEDAHSTIRLFLLPWSRRSRRRRTRRRGSRTSSRP